MKACHFCSGSAITMSNIDPFEVSSMPGTGCFSAGSAPSSVDDNFRSRLPCISFAEYVWKPTLASGAWLAMDANSLAHVGLASAPPTSLANSRVTASLPS